MNAKIMFLSGRAPHALRDRFVTALEGDDYWHFGAGRGSRKLHRHPAARRLHGAWSTTRQYVRVSGKDDRRHMKRGIDSISATGRCGPAVNRSLTTQGQALQMQPTVSLQSELARCWRTRRSSARVLRRCSGARSYIDYRGVHAEEYPWQVAVHRFWFLSAHHDGRATCAAVGARIGEEIALTLEA